MKQYADLDFSKAAKILNVLVDPVASDDTGLGTGQMWFNTTSKFFKGYDGTTKFSLLRDDLAVTITGVFTFNPGSGNVPFAVHSSKTDVVTYLNADEVDGYDASESATASTLAARDASGNVTVATPTSDGHAATKAYVDSIAAGQDWKDSCVVATTANITLSGEQTIDGVAVVAGDRVLVKNQSTASQNGLYTCSSGAWSRTADSDENAEVTSGLTTYIEAGTENAGAGYTLTTSGTIVVGTTALTFTRTSGGNVYSAGNGMVKSGTTFHFGQAASYTVGALPYADGSDSIGFISAVASGKVLKSNGTGTVPLWAAVDLTADVTGTLPVGNGGTGTATQFTSGSVVFSGASGVYSQDNSNLFWNNTDKRLSIGSNSGTNTLNVTGTGYFSGNVGIGTTSPSNKLEVAGTIMAGNQSSGSSGQIILRSREATSYWRTTVGSMYSSGNAYFGRTVKPSTSAETFVAGVTGTTGGGAVVIGNDGSLKFWQVPSQSLTLDAAITTLNTYKIWHEGNDGPSSGLNSDTVDGYEASALLDLANSTGDTDDISEGATNLYYTDGRARTALSGVADRISYTSSTGVIDIASTYVGQSTITTLGTIATGTWNGTVIANGYGGTGQSTYAAGDMLYASAINTLSKLTVGATDTVMRVAGGVPTWSAIDSAVWDGSYLSAFDTDDLAEGVTNLFYTDARARGAISSTASAELAYNSSTGVLGLGTEAGRVKSGTLGAGASPTFSHNLGTRDVICQVFRTASPYDEVRPEIKRTDTNTVTIEFTGITPSSGEFTVVCTAANG